MNFSLSPRIGSLLNSFASFVMCSGVGATHVQDGPAKLIRTLSGSAWEAMEKTTNTALETWRIRFGFGAPPANERFYTLDVLAVRKIVFPSPIQKS